MGYHLLPSPLLIHCSLLCVGNFCRCLTRADFVFATEKALTSDRHGRKCLLNAKTTNFGRDRGKNRGRFRLQNTSMINLPRESVTATEIVAWWTSIPIDFSWLITALLSVSGDATNHYLSQ